MIECPINSEQCLTHSAHQVSTIIIIIITFCGLGEMCIKIVEML